MSDKLGWRATAGSVPSRVRLQRRGWPRSAPGVLAPVLESLVDADVDRVFQWAVAGVVDGINALGVFPDLQGLAQHLTGRYGVCIDWTFASDEDRQRGPSFPAAGRVQTPSELWTGTIGGRRA